MYGNKVPAHQWTPSRSVIGRVERSIDGNIIIRVGRVFKSGFQQTEHVVLTPEEVDTLVDTLVTELHTLEK